jgi:hypothetical protein
MPFIVSLTFVLLATSPLVIFLSLSLQARPVDLVNAQEHVVFGTDEPKSATH